MPRVPKWKMYAERKKQLDEKFHKMHEEQSQKYGMFWVGMNEKLTNLVQREFPEVGFIITEHFPNVPYRKELYRTMLSRIALFMCEEIVKASTPPLTPEEAEREKLLKDAFAFWEDVQKGCKKCGASVKGHMVFPKKGGGPLCKKCAEERKEK